MSIREQHGEALGPLFLDRLAAGGDLTLPNNVPDVRGYVDLALRSGFPEAAFTDSPRLRRRWLDGYIEQLVTRDATELGVARDPNDCGGSSSLTRWAPPASFRNRRSWKLPASTARRPTRMSAFSPTCS
jgi:hypothetical protein